MLTRSSSDKIVAGVAGGLGRYFGVDPIVFRIAFVALTLAGGTGVALYAAGWLLMPEDNGGESVLGRALRPDGHRRPIVGIVLIGLVFIMLADSFRFGRHDGPLFPIALIAIGLAILWTRNGGSHGGAGWSRTSAHAPADPAAAAATDEPLWVPPAETMTMTAPSPAVRAGRVPSLTGVVAGALVVAGGLVALMNATGVVHVSLRGFLGGGLLVTGAALLLSIWRGGTRGLVAVGLVLAMALVMTTLADRPLHGGIGNRAWRPASTSELRRQYRVGIGNMTLDLRDVRLAEGVSHVRASVGIGELRVIAPAGVDVRVTGRAGMGNVELFGEQRDGVSVEQTDTDHASVGTAAGLLELDLRTGIGDVRVDRTALP